MQKSQNARRVRPRRRNPGPRRIKQQATKKIDLVFKENHTHDSRGLSGRRAGPMDKEIAPQKERREIGYEMVKNVIKNQNRQLIERIAEDFGRNKERLLQRYLKPEYYLPIVEKNG